MAAPTCRAQARQLEVRARDLTCDALFRFAPSGYGTNGCNLIMTLRYLCRHWLQPSDIGIACQSGRTPVRRSDVPVRENRPHLTVAPPDRTYGQSPLMMLKDYDAAV